MTKVNKSNELMLVANMLPVEGGTPLVQVTRPDSRLPSFKIVYPIEVDGTKIKPEHSFAFGFTTGDGFTKLDAGVVLTVLAGRDAARRLCAEVDGKQVLHDKNNPAHAKLEAKYDRCFKGLGQFTTSHGRFMAVMKEPGWDSGSVYLVVAFTKNGAILGELPAFKTAASYWFRPLSQAVLNPNKLGMEILTDNHSTNLRASKNNPQMKYLDAGKFTQFKVVELSQEQLAQVVSAVEEATGDIQDWFDR